MIITQQLVLFAFDLHLVLFEGIQEALIYLFLKGSLYLLQNGLVPALHVVDLDDFPHELQSLCRSSSSDWHIEL